MSLYSWEPKRLRHVMPVDEAADLVGMHPDTIRRAVARGENIGFPVFKAGRRYVVPKKPLYRALGIEEGTK